MRYLAHIRTLRLAHLLVETDLPIGVAMTKVGWRSRGHAARQFTGIVGTSPWPSATQGSPESKGPLTTGVQ